MKSDDVYNRQSSGISLESLNPYFAAFSNFYALRIRCSWLQNLHMSLAKYGLPFLSVHQHNGMS